MKKIITFVVIFMAALSLDAQVLGLNLGDDSALVKQKLLKLGFELNYDMGSEVDYEANKPVKSEDGFLVTRAHCFFENNKLACVNIDYPYILCPVMCSIAYHEFLTGKGDWDLDRLEEMSGEARRWRMFENTLILGNNQRWRGYELLNLANSNRGHIHAELYFTNGRDAVGIEWYDDDVVMSWGTAEFYGLR